MCSYEGRGGLCSIRLSEPLLKLRPRKDLVEVRWIVPPRSVWPNCFTFWIILSPQTLLHEMIHALLFVMQNNRDRDGHGPEFCKHMNRINKASGTKITVSQYFAHVSVCRSLTRAVSDFSPSSSQIYHSFHDEVDVYRQHWWRCNGSCQSRKPYFGYVKRAMNRAPSALDPWWEDHRRTCGGTYIKVKEPEGYGKKGKKDAKKEGKNLENKATGNTKTASAGDGIIPIPPVSLSQSHLLSSIQVLHFEFVYFCLLGSGLQDIRNIIPFGGKGFVLGGNSSSSACPPPSHKQGASDANTSSSNTSSSNSIFSPKKPFTLSSPTRILGSPVRSSLADKGNYSAVASSRSATVTGLKPPIKKSVGNSKAFVNINGSPVKIPKSHGNANNKDAKKTQQKSIEDLFSFRNPSEMPAVSSATASSASRTPKPSSSTPDGYSTVGLERSHGSPAEPTESKYFNHSSSSASRKRSWDVHNDSASIFDFFQKTISADSSVRIKPPAVQQTAAAACTAATSSVQSSGVTSSAALMVACPVCQAKVQESKINEHLDSCLS